MGSRNNFSMIEKCINEHKIYDAYDMLGKEIALLGNWDLEQELENAKNTYRYMLEYMINGTVDPQSKSLYLKLVQQAFSMCDSASRGSRIKKNTGDKYCATLNSLPDGTNLQNIFTALETYGEASKRNVNPDSQKLKERKDDHERTLLQMFNHIWTSPQWSNSDKECANAMLMSENIDDNDNAILVSAATLSLFEYFDIRKLEFLFDAYEAGCTIASQRALVGIIMIIIRYDGRLKNYPEISARMALISDDNKSFKENAYTILTQLQLSKDTDKVNAKMRNEIIPEIMKSGKFRQTGFGFEEIDEALTKNDENPDWSKSGSKLNEKLAEMTELQMEGADVYMGTFSQLKSYPFFNDIAHWFYPFDIKHPALGDFEKNHSSKIMPMIKAILNAGPFSNSDKYSFCFMLSSIGGIEQSMMTNKMAEGMLDEEAGSIFKNAETMQPKAKDFSRQYIYDLYRFFNLYLYRTQFSNPFNDVDGAYTPLKATLLGSLMEDRRQVMEYAEFLMKKKYYTEASKLFESLSPALVEDDAELWQKLAFCYQKSNNPQALEAYINADSLKPNSTWTISHEAHAARMFGNFKLAAECYNRLLENDSDNIKYLKRKSECLIADENYEEALPVLYKINYLDESSTVAKRMIAWCLLMTNKLDKAISTYEDICTEGASANDWMNLGHCLLASGKMKEAVNAYTSGMKATINDKGNAEDFDKGMEADAEILSRFNIGKEELRMILDAIRFSCEN